ncbi:MAG: transcription elongation factor GreA [Clostridia bacterium]
MAEMRLTAEGVTKYEDRLEYLKTTGRTEIAEQIKIARSFGDLSENAEYDAAKAEQSRIEYEIAEIENMLRNVVLIDEDNLDTEIVSVGAIVQVQNMSSNINMSFQIVGSAEANPLQNRISNEAPIGKALLGKKKDEIVDVNTPGGVVKLKVLSIGK